MAIQISPDVVIPDSELEVVFSRAGGPGGQNVNKVETKVTLRYHVAGSAALNEAQKARIGAKLASRISVDGILQVSSQKFRSQPANREAATARLAELLRSALAEQKPRRKTRVSRAAKARRLEEKRHLSKKKRIRRDQE